MKSTIVNRTIANSQKFALFQEKRKSLETQMHRLQIMERREEELKRQVTEKSHHITQLAERIAVSYYFSWDPFTLSVSVNDGLTLAIML